MDDSESKYALSVSENLQQVARERKHQNLLLSLFPLRQTRTHTHTHTHTCHHFCNCLSYLVDYQLSGDRDQVCLVTAVPRPLCQVTQTQHWMHLTSIIKALISSRYQPFGKGSLGKKTKKGIERIQGENEKRRHRSEVEGSVGMRSGGGESYDE